MQCTTSLLSVLRFRKNGLNRMPQKCCFFRADDVSKIKILPKSSSFARASRIYISRAVLIGRISWSSAACVCVWERGKELLKIFCIYQINIIPLLPTVVTFLKEIPFILEYVCAIVFHRCPCNCFPLLNLPSLVFRTLKLLI